MSTSESQVQVTKKEDKPLLIPDFIEVYTGIAWPEEHEIGSSGRLQVIVRAYKKKNHHLWSLFPSLNGWGQGSKS